MISALTEQRVNVPRAAHLSDADRWRLTDFFGFLRAESDNRPLTVFSGHRRDLSWVPLGRRMEPRTFGAISAVLKLGFLPLVVCEGAPSDFAGFCLCQEAGGS